MSNTNDRPETTIRCLYVTCADAGQAVDIARTLLEERLVACVNLLPEIRSLYRWKGAVHDEREALFFAKTTEEHVPRALERIRELHSYECPCILVLPVMEGHPPFLEWVRDQCAPS